MPDQVSDMAAAPAPAAQTESNASQAATQTPAKPAASDLPGEAPLAAPVPAAMPPASATPPASSVQAPATQTPAAVAPPVKPIESTGNQTAAAPTEHTPLTLQPTDDSGFLGLDSGLAHSALTSGLALVGMLVLLFLGFWLIRRFGPRSLRRGSGPLSPTLKGRIMLGPKQSLAVVKVLDKVLVLGVTEKRVSLLDKVTLEQCRTMTPDGLDPDEDEHAFTRFAEMLGRKESPFRKSAARPSSETKAKPASKSAAPGQPDETNRG